MDFLDNSVKVSGKGGSIEVITGSMFSGKTFGPIPAFLAISEYVTKVQAICIRCGNLAQYSFRKSEEAQVVLLGEKSLYEPLSRNCFNTALNK